MQSLVFRIASEQWEFEEIHKLNYETFVDEIPQHGRNPDRKLVDKFHDQNTYAICLLNGQLTGMLALRGQRPFSLDFKLENLDSYLPCGRSVCEIRLLAVRKNMRNGGIFHGLIKMAMKYFEEHGYDLAVISGTTRQQKLYRHMGFIPFGPLVGKQGALYQPMYLSIESFREKVESVSDNGNDPGVKDATCGKANSAGKKPFVNLMPGPVQVHQNVLDAFRVEPFSHRSDHFIAEFKETKRMLCELVGTLHAEIFQGSGTLANDVIAAELSLGHFRGLILVNGEFGERLVDHAERQELEFDVIRSGWGDPFDYSLVEQHLEKHDSVEWIWFVHCETSTGVLNDLPGILGICRKRGIKVCVDAISSIGTLPVALGDVYLASCVSGKGLASLPGLAVVFHNHEIASGGRKVPRYYDLGYYAAAKGVPFTFSSNMLHAFRAALKRFRSDSRFKMIRQMSEWLRGEMRKRGHRILASDNCASPAVTTIVLPPSVSSRQIGLRLEERGCLLSCNSEYLLKRNWLQICLMGECSLENLAWAVDQLSDVGEENIA
ncbi:MAG: aminotransferase class V-fold PLP-dependent enzyme [Kiritimatiellae bacterium]|nr:aminotransferase class V-fold PLP-dependent enzyme [Kiritimatiellia bacterium]MDD5522308.1 aminotransferase class V-fold PLP-dependent enzyme [Kiritimatiellia bacterium]